MRRAWGFTLIELMIVVSIVAILTAIAMPSYNEQVRKGRRSTAKTVLMDVAGRQERYYTANNTYADTLAKLGLSASLTTSDGAYAISIAPDPGGIVAGFIATATLSGSFTDPKCGNLSLASTGAKTTSVSPGTGCW
jgi:type IV pilus assembly protein PilE